MKYEKIHLQKLLNSGSIELRCFDSTSDLAKKQKQGKVIRSAIFDDYSALSQAAIFASSQGWDVYNTINPLKITATNGRLKPFQRTARDSDVSEIRTIFFDFDPIRETGTAATPEQVQFAIDEAIRLSEYLDQEGGWSIPVLGWSGNGAHLYYSTQLSANKETKKSLDGLYAGLAKRFGNDVVGFDVVVRNPARIARTLGTINTKSGTRSKAMFVSEFTEGELITNLADKISPPKKAKPTWVRPASEQKAGKFIKNWDIVGAFSQAGLYLQPTQEIGKHFVTCPWQHEHSETGATDTVVFEGEWPQFHCSHNHCADRDIATVIGLLTDGVAA